MQETQFWSLGQEDPLEKDMATHSNISAWQIPWTEEPGYKEFFASGCKYQPEQLTLSVFRRLVDSGAAGHMVEYWVAVGMRLGLDSFIRSTRQSLCAESRQRFQWVWLARYSPHIWKLLCCAVNLTWAHRKLTRALWMEEVKFHYFSKRYTHNGVH